MFKKFFSNFKKKNKKIFFFKQKIIEKFFYKYKNSLVLVKGINAKKIKSKSKSNLKFIQFLKKKHFNFFHF